MSTDWSSFFLESYQRGMGDVLWGHREISAVTGCATLLFPHFVEGAWDQLQQRALA